MSTNAINTKHMECLWGIPKTVAQTEDIKTTVTFQQMLGINSTRIDKWCSTPSCHTAAKVVHLVGALGAYIAFSRLIGTLRILTGVVLIISGGYIAINKLKEKEDEKEKNALVQQNIVPIALGLIIRGALEAFIPFGKVLNAVGDIVQTSFNYLLINEGKKQDRSACESSATSDHFYDENHSTSSVNDGVHSARYETKDNKDNNEESSSSSSSSSTSSTNAASYPSCPEGAQVDQAL